jgi:hypothetical protein
MSSIKSNEAIPKKWAPSILASLGLSGILIFVGVRNFDTTFGVVLLSIGGSLFGGLVIVFDIRAWMVYRRRVKSGVEYPVRLGTFVDAVRDSFTIWRAGRKPGPSDTRVLTNGLFLASLCSDGISLSTHRDGVRISRDLSAGLLAIDNGKANYYATHVRSAAEGVTNVKLVRVNASRSHTTDTDFFFESISQNDFYSRLFRKNVLDRTVKQERFDSFVSKFRPLFVKMDETYATAYQRVSELIKRASSQGFYYDKSEWENVGIERWKGNFGAATTVNRKNCSVDVRPLSGVKQNIPAIKIGLGGADYWLFPDAIVQVTTKLMQYGKVRVCPLKNLEFYVESNTYTTDKVPRGVTPIGHTWEYVNKNGGPDMRYKDNAQRAILDVIQLTVAENDLVLFSITLTATKEAKEIASLLKSMSATFIN